MADGLGVAVIGAGLAGRAHAAAYRTASALYSPVLPPVRLVSIGDVNSEFGSLAARRCCAKTAERHPGRRPGDGLGSRDSGARRLPRRQDQLHVPSRPRHRLTSVS